MPHNSPATDAQYFVDALRKNDFTEFLKILDYAFKLYGQHSQEELSSDILIPILISELLKTDINIKDALKISVFHDIIKELKIGDSDFILTAFQAAIRHVLFYKKLLPELEKQAAKTKTLSQYEIIRNKITNLNNYINFKIRGHATYEKAETLAKKLLPLTKSNEYTNFEKKLTKILKKETTLEIDKLVKSIDGYLDLVELGYNSRRAKNDAANSKDFFETIINHIKNKNYLTYSDITTLKKIEQRLLPAQIEKKLNEYNDTSSEKMRENYLRDFLLKANPSEKTTIYTNLAKQEIKAEAARNFIEKLQMDIEKKDWSKLVRFGGGKCINIPARKVTSGNNTIEIPAKSIKVPTHVVEIYNLCVRVNNKIPGKEISDKQVLKIYEEILNRGTKASNSFSFFFKRAKGTQAFYDYLKNTKSVETKIAAEKIKPRGSRKR